MNKRRLYSLMVGLGVALAVALALVFGVFSPGADRGAEPETGATTSTEDGESGPALEASVSDADVAPEGAGGGPVEGIKVYGHWIIEVRDPDGSLVSRHEFDNDLHPQGIAALPEIIGGLRTPGFWAIRVANVNVGGALNASQPCSNNAAAASPCFIVETGDPTTGNAEAFVTLTVAFAAAGGGDPDRLVLSGSATAANTADITEVTTFNTHCLPTNPPSGNCSGAGGTTSTITKEPLDLAGPHPVIASVFPGQVINVTVEISFN